MRIIPDKLINFNHFLLNAFFPKHCIQCGQYGNYICSKCLKSIPLLALQTCPGCNHAITQSGSLCKTCLEENIAPSLNHLLVAADYRNKLLASLIHAYKYRFITDLSEPLSTFLSEIILRHRLPIPDIIIPVPLHPRRIRWRGFNQSLLLGRFLANTLCPGFTIPLREDLLLRVKNTRPQMTLPKAQERKKNIQDAFAVPSELQPELTKKRLLLVDDVSTSGATLLECAQTLKKYYPKSVDAVVIARQQSY
jgi:ComF family protein